MEKIICKFDSKPKATIGFVQVASDMTIDRDIGPVLRQIPGILWRSARMRFEEGDVEINENVYERSKKYISEASKSFLPLNNKLYGSIDIMAMFCTSMSFVLGPDTVQSELRKGYPTAHHYVDMATAVVNAIKAVCKLSCHTTRPRIALLTPYICTVHKRNAEFLNKNGIDVIAECNLGFKTDDVTSALTPETLSEFAKYISSSNDSIDALFIGCSAFNSTGYDFIDQLENAIGKPVITSNQATIWYCLKMCESIAESDLLSIKGYGKLFSLSK